jgi:ABC-type spermidine/putrescine transport system permease subunit I
LIADLIGEQLNFAAGSAMAVVLLILTAAAFGVFVPLQRVGRQRIAPTAARAR